MQRLTANQQLSTLIAIKAAMRQGKRFDVICSELMNRNGGAVADAWQRCEMKLSEGNDYSKSLASTELFDDGVLSILMLANDCERWSIAIDAAIDYLGWCFAGNLPIQTAVSGCDWLALRRWFSDEDAKAFLENANLRKVFPTKKKQGDDAGGKPAL